MTSTDEIRTHAGKILKRKLWDHNFEVKKILPKKKTLKLSTLYIGSATCVSGKVSNC